MLDTDPSLGGVQWVKINNLTAQFIDNPYVSEAAGIAAGGGWGLLPWYLTA